MNPLKLFVFASLALFMSNSALSQTENHKDFGDYRVHFSLFNSSFLPEAVAAGYGFVRANNRGILNIAATEIAAGGNSRGLPIQIKGEFTNLLQQKTSLDFVPVEEKDAVYYLSEFKFNDQEVMNFTIHVLLPGQQRSNTVTFSKSLYRD